MMDAFHAKLEACDPARGRFRAYRIDAGTDLLGDWLGGRDLWPHRLTGQADSPRHGRSGGNAGSCGIACNVGFRVVLPPDNMHDYYPGKKDAQDISPNGQREAPDPTPILLAGVIIPTIRKRAKTPREIESSPAACFVGL